MSGLALLHLHLPKPARIAASLVRELIARGAAPRGRYSETMGGASAVWIPAGVATMLLARLECSQELAGAPGAGGGGRAMRRPAGRLW
jgi:hypothetical protein